MLFYGVSGFQYFNFKSFYAFFDKIDKCCQDTSMFNIFIIWLIVMNAETKHNDVATHAMSCRLTI